MSNFMKSLKAEHRVLLLIRGLCLLFDATVTVIAKFISSAVEKIYKLCVM